MGMTQKKRYENQINAVDDVTRKIILQRARKLRLDYIARLTANINRLDNISISMGVDGQPKLYFAGITAMVHYSIQQFWPKAKAELIAEQAIDAKYK